MVVLPDSVTGPVHTLEPLLPPLELGSLGFDRLLAPEQPILEPLDLLPALPEVLLGLPGLDVAPCR